MPDFEPRGREINWPQPWEGIGLGWYDGARERRGIDMASAEIEAARHDLTTTLAEQPTVYWLPGCAEIELAEAFGIPRHAARKLLRDTPGAVLIADGWVWCAVSAAAAWSDFKRKVRETLKTDALLTLEAIAAAVKVDAISTLSALAVLCDRDHAAVCIRESPEQAARFCRARPGGAMASYADLVEARTAA